METTFTTEEIEHYTARFKVVMDLKQEHYTKKEHQECRDNFTRRMKQYNERTLANYNLSFDLFCLAVSKDCALKRQLDQINELKQELEHMKHCHNLTTTYFF
jgi:Holliday junction resolvase RusA-like endonuclease